MYNFLLRIWVWVFISQPGQAKSFLSVQFALKFLNRSEVISLSHTFLIAFLSMSETYKPQPSDTFEDNML